MKEREGGREWGKRQSINPSETEEKEVKKLNEPLGYLRVAW